MNELIFNLFQNYVVLFLGLKTLIRTGIYVLTDNANFSDRSLLEKKVESGIIRPQIPARIYIFLWAEEVEQYRTEEYMYTVIHM